MHMKTAIENTCVPVQLIYKAKKLVFSVRKLEHCHDRGEIWGERYIPLTILPQTCSKNFYS